MKLNDPINISLLEFFKTGKFDYLKLGQTKEWILNNFPDPDGSNNITYHSSIWFYGNIELHFQEDETLFLIYSDHIDSLDGGPSLHLDKWIFNQPGKLTLEYTIQHLNKERINFKLEHKMDSQGFVTVRLALLESRVMLGFAPEETEEETLSEFLARCKIEDSNNFKMISFSLSNF